MAIKKKKPGYQGTIVNADGQIVKEGDPSLVVDLPDGQKIIVGELPEGTIIEVATWRGTGRPDSRANRLLLGVGSSQGFTPPESNPKSQPVSKKSEVTAEDSISNTQPIPKITLSQRINLLLKQIRPKPKEKTRNDSIKRTESQDTVRIEGIAKTDSESFDSSGLDAYIDQLMSQTLSGGKPTSAKSSSKSASTKKPAKKSATTKKK